jgi:hypothetical protein
MAKERRDDATFGRNSARFESVLGVFEAVTRAVDFQDMDPVGQSVQQRASQSFAAHDLDPLLKGQIGR